MQPLGLGMVFGVEVLGFTWVGGQVVKLGVLGLGLMPDVLPVLVTSSKKVVVLVRGEVAFLGAVVVQ